VAGEEIPQANDKLFSSAFAVPENAAGLLQAKLPSAVATAIDCSRLRLLPGSFVDSQFRRSLTDLLFVAPLESEDALIYVLFEHQSTLDRLLPLRLLRYMVRIWEGVAQEAGSSAPLPVILPVVLSQNAKTWDLCPHFAGLLNLPAPIAGDLLPFVPDFLFQHLQLADMAFDAIPGTAAGIFVLRAMKAERSGRLLDDAVWDEELIARLPAEVFHLVLRYIIGSDVDKEGFEARILSLKDPESRTIAMTLAQRYRQEGRQEGVLKGRQEDVLEALVIRFSRVPEGLREAIMAEEDDAKLRRLFRTALECSSLEDFAQTL